MKAYRIGWVAAASAALLLAACSSQQSDWHQAQQKNTVSSYRKYLKKYPDGKHVSAAKQDIAHIKKQRKMEQARADWQRAKNQDTLAAYQGFLQNHSNSQFASQARQKIQQQKALQDWQQARQSNNPRVLQRFIARYPNSPQASMAHQKLAKLRARQQQQQQQQGAATGQAGQQQAAGQQQSSQQQSSQQQSSQQQSSGDYQVQLGAFSSQSKARSGQKQLQSKLGDELNGASIKVFSPTGGSSLYRLKTTSMSKHDARALCQSFKNNGTDCFVVKRPASSSGS